MRYRAIDIANYVVQQGLERGVLVTNLHLQKALYFLQAYYIIEKNEVLFEDNIEMWRLGPVVPGVYDEYKGFGSAGITAVAVTSVFDRKRLLIIRESFDDTILSQGTKEVLNPLIDSLLKRDPFYLLNKACGHSLWKDNKENIFKSKDARGGFVYNLKDIQQFFSEETCRSELFHDIF